MRVIKGVIKNVNKHTRADKFGKIIFCPNCKKTVVVYHFSWCSLTCIYCESEVKKFDWLVWTKE